MFLIEISLWLYNIDFIQKQSLIQNIIIIFVEDVYSHTIGKFTQSYLSDRVSFLTLAGRTKQKRHFVFEKSFLRGAHFLGLLVWVNK